MSQRTYFLVNDTRYDNHHGCLTVVRNLHAAMAARGWRCTGSLPVSSPASKLREHAKELDAAELVVVNGEGSLHHDSRNARRIFAVCEALRGSHPLALVNAVWQDNDAQKWRPLLARFKAVYARDRRSQRQLREIVPQAGYAPDLTFYAYPRFQVTQRAGYFCTDSVVNAWTEAALKLVAQDDEIDLYTLFTGRMEHLRGARDWSKCVKYRLYPLLWETLHVNVPPRYKTLKYAEAETGELLRRFSGYRAACVARYHALCFVIQQRIPFLAVASNSHKSESLIEEMGLPLDRFLIAPNGLSGLKERLAGIARDYPDYAEQVEAFNLEARKRIEEMFDQVTAS